MDTPLNDRPRQDGPGVATTASRRLFLKRGSLALPAVVTLHSGAARAATSIGCGGVGNVAQDGYAILTAQDHADERLRVAVELYKLVKVKSGGDPNNVPTDWEIDTTSLGAYFQAESGSWRKLDGQEVDGNELLALQAFAADPQIKTGTTQYAIVHVSTADGSVAAIGSPDPVPNAIVTSWTGACMASLYGVGPAPV